RKSVQAIELFEDADSGRSRVLTFQRLKLRVLQNAPHDKLRKRVESPFVAVMTRTIDSRVAQARKLKEDEEKLQQNFQAVRETIWKQYQMRIDDGDSDAHRIVVEGRFETTANLWADPSYMELAPGEV